MIKISYMLVPAVPKVDLGFDSTRSDRIIGIVCAYYNTNYDKIKKKGRRRGVVMPRQISMYFLRKHTKIGVTNIARLFRMDHTTVIHSSRTIEDLIFSDETIRTQIREIENKILS